VASRSNQPVTQIGVVAHPHVSAADELGQRIAHAARQRGVRVWQSHEVDNPEVTERIAGTDLLVTLGGDGSILRAARAAVGHSTLILGVNLGRVGFLTEAEPADWETVLFRVLEGDYWIESRMMLRAEARRDEEPLAHGEALNDVVVGKKEAARVVHLDVCVDHERLAYYVADGLIVATPTGSTAYALAAGGPIMPPQQRNILLVPVAPHLTLSKAVVLAEGVQVQVVLRGHQTAALTLDGETVAELKAGDAVRVESSPHVARFARVREKDYFYRTLMARLVPKEPGLRQKGQADE